MKSTEPGKLIEAEMQTELVSSLMSHEKNTVAAHVGRQDRASISNQKEIEMTNDAFADYRPRPHHRRSFRKELGDIFGVVMDVQDINNNYQAPCYVVQNWRTYLDMILRGMGSENWTTEDLKEVALKTYITCDAWAYLYRVKGKAATGFGLKIYVPRSDKHR